MFEVVVKIFLGVLLVAAGLLMLVTPGPGLLVLALGILLVLSQFVVGRRLVARMRLFLRRRFGSPRVRRFEDRLPRDLIPPADTAELNLEALRPSRRRDEDAEGREGPAARGA